LRGVSPRLAPPSFDDLIDAILVALWIFEYLRAKGDNLLRWYGALPSSGYSLLLSPDSYLLNTIDRQEKITEAVEASKDFKLDLEALGQLQYLIQIVLRDSNDWYGRLLRTQPRG
jgi:hypothetical protein